MTDHTSVEKDNYSAAVFDTKEDVVGYLEANAAELATDIAKKLAVEERV